jgi:4-amino-4-deoxy-L-arabinose transferase-like glycosyltransferase
VSGRRLSRAAWALVGVLLLLWLVGLGAYPLLESTEGRYASIAAAMVRSGDYLEPRFDGLLHLDKPPLAYWAGALSIRVLHGSEFAVRLPAALALVLSAWLVMKIGLAAGLDSDRARRAGLLAALAPLAVAQGHMLSSDIFLWVGILAVFYGLSAQSAPPARRALWTGLGLCAGFLAKGHIVLLWVVPAVLVWAVVDGRRRAAAILVHPVSLLAFLVAAAPWFVLLLRRHPGLLDFWLKGETVDRYLTTVHGRGEPWWYFFALLPLCVLPWLPEAVRGVARAVARDATRDASRDAKEASARRLWLLWAFVPFVILCFSGSKRPNYLLPMIAPLALLAAAQSTGPLGRFARARLGVWIAVALLVPFAMRLVPETVPPTKRLVESVRAQYAVAGRAGAAGQPDVIAYRVLPSSLEFYWGAPVPAADCPRFHAFDTQMTAARLLPSVEEMAARVREGALLLLKERDAARVEALLGEPLVPVARDGNLLVLGRSGSP